MKKMILWAALLLPMVVNSQIIDWEIYSDYVIYKNGEKEFVDILEESKKSLLVKKDLKQMKVAKSDLSDFRDGKLWSFPFPYGDDGGIEFTQVVKIDSVSQNELYLRSKKAFSDLFKDSKAVLELDDKEMGIITGTGNVTVNGVTLGFLATAFSATMWFDLSIEVKDGRYRITVKNIERDVPASQYSKGGRFAIEPGYRDYPDLNPDQKQFKEDLLRKIDNVFLSVIQLMSQKSKKDW
jgi:hypothetical protein